MWALVATVAVDLAAREPARVEAAVAAIEARPDEDGGDLLAAGLACEERLGDPARALRLYERVLRERPDDRAAIAAGRRAAALRGELGAHGEHAAEARELAALVAGADTLPEAELVRRGDALAGVAWPGAPGAALWLASWEPRADRCGEARPRFEAIFARWPGSPEGALALRGAATCALDAHAWSDAVAIAQRIPDGEPGDRDAREDLLRTASRGRLRARLTLAAWIALAVVLAGLLRALAVATRGLPLRARLRPPVEALYLAPVVAAVIAVAALGQPQIAPAVAIVTLGSFALTWLSGRALVAHRAAGRDTRARSLAHAAVCAVAVVALAYLALSNAELVDPLLDTLRFGPD